MPSDITIRCSSLPAAVACPASVLPCDLPVNDDNDSARIGLALHRCIALHIQGRRVDVWQVCEMFGVQDSTREVEILFSQARSMWHETLREHFPEPRCEESISYQTYDGRATLTGHADVYSLTPFMADAQARINDWKGLAVDTPIPTPSGWSTMGQLSVGDQVFGADGKPCSVVAKSSVHYRPCYRVQFDDGSSIVADSVHLWKVVSSKSGCAQVVSTEELKTLIENRKKQREWYIPNCAPLDLPEAQLPIPPYTLGCWLGDGKKSAGDITKPDEEMFSLISSDGYFVGPPHGQGGVAKCPTRTVYGLRKQLRHAGILGSRAVPKPYLRASAGQRLALLRGLMDTDGTWNAVRGQAVFDSTDFVLAGVVYELAVSLGCRASRWTGRGFGFGREVVRHTVTFRPPEILNPFASSAKGKLFGVGVKNPIRTGRRIVVAVSKCETVATQCVAVDSADHLYLAGRQMVPTHNTGREDYDAVPQLKGYALCAMAKAAELGHRPNAVYASISWIREMEIEGYLWDRDHLISWADDVLGSMAQPYYHVGRACRTCRRRLDCAARDRWVESSLRLVMQVEATQNYKPMKGNDGWGEAAVLDAAKTVEAIAKDAREVIRQRVADAGGKIPFGETGAVQLVQQRQEEINVEAAWSTLLGRFGLDGVLAMAKVGKGAVAELIGERAAEGAKGREIAEFMETLRGKGAVREKLIERLEVRRARNEKGLVAS